MRRAVALVAGLALAGSAQAALKLGEAQAQRSPEQVKNVGPVIRGRGLPAEAVEYQVRHGQNAMPAFRPTEITPAELKALAAWIQTSAADPKEHGQ